jgi:peroxiredoxin
MSTKAQNAPTAIDANMVALSRCEVQNENGDLISLFELWKNHTAILIFLRHFGCIFCRRHAKEVWNEREKYEKNGAKINFIGNGAPFMIKAFKEELEIEEAPIFTDPSLNSFKAAGFKRGFLAALGPRVVINAAKALAEGHAQGGLYKKEQGDLWQLGGILVVKSNGTPAYQFISQAAGDFSPEQDEVTY